METFREDVNLERLITSSTVVVIDISSQWCGPCNMITPVLESLSKQFDPSAVKIYKIDVTNGAPKFVIDMGIKNVPTLLFYKDGELKLTETGFKNKEQMFKLINDLL